MLAHLAQAGERQRPPLDLGAPGAMEQAALCPPSCGITLAKAGKALQGWRGRRGGLQPRSGSGVVGLDAAWGPG